jgi:hypothetical protein
MPKRFVATSRYPLIRAKDIRASVARMSEAISGAFLSPQNPACRYAHAGYLLRATKGSFPASAGQDGFRYFSDNASPLKSRLTIRPFCSPVSVNTAPFWLARTTACAPRMAAAPAPPWA